MTKEREKKEGDSSFMIVAIPFSTNCVHFCSSMIDSSSLGAVAVLRRRHSGGSLRNFGVQPEVCVCMVRELDACKMLLKVDVM